MRRTFAFPALQLLSAALSLGAWFLLGASGESSLERVAIAGLTYGAPLSLVLTAGISYVLPNSYRGFAHDDRRLRGPWSDGQSICAVVCIVAAMGGLALSVTDITLVAGVILSTAAILAVSVLVGQIARATLSVRTAVAGSAGPWVVPVAWLLAASVGVAPDVAARATVAVNTLVLLMQVLTVRASAAPLRELDFRRVRDVAKVGIPLVPHLAMFGMLIQGLRIPASLWGSAEIVLSAHYLMLSLSVGFTILASFNGILSVSVQAAADDEAMSEVRRAALVLVCVGTATSGLVTLIVAVANELADLGLDVVHVTAAGLTASVLTFYYSLSGQAMRGGATTRIACSSAGSLLVFMMVTLAARDRSLDDWLLIYVGSVLVMPLLLWLGIVVRKPSHSGRVVGVAVWAIPAGALVSGVVAISL